MMGDLHIHREFLPQNLDLVCPSLRDHARVLGILVLVFNDCLQSRRAVTGEQDGLQVEKGTEYIKLAADPVARLVRGAVVFQWRLSLCGQLDERVA